ncbi:hypothetical protein [Caenimonas soli]|uniref:hypothetical protein n=1 Tax=Caenimonas soli TaxID=2735555 RepID=UPI001556A73B|nr:hypothetical protein [Caenimonas soli]NPC57007.1 hypothetical protein [Caenimonas soli]
MANTLLPTGFDIELDIAYEKWTQALKDLATAEDRLFKIRRSLTQQEFQKLKVEIAHKKKVTDELFEALRTLFEEESRLLPLPPG